MSTCLELVGLQIKDLDQKELDQVLDQLKEKQARLIQKGQDPQTAAAKAGMDTANTLRAAAAIARRNAALDQLKRTEALDYLANTWQDDPTEGLLALIYGSPKARFGSRTSVNAAQDAQFRRVMGGVAGELEAAGLFNPLRRGEMDRDVALAMWHVNDEAKLREMPEQAVQVAKILRKWQEVARIEANRHGAWIGRDENYVVRQSHHPDRLSNAGLEEWKKAIQPHLDLERMFPDARPESLDVWLDETYMNLTTGVRVEKGDVSATREAAFKGPGNLAKSISQERVIHFKSAEEWFDYNQKFGYGNIREAYVQGLHSSSETTGLMQVLGTNPEANLDTIYNAVRARLSRADPAKLIEFDRKTRRGTRIENAYKEVSGFTRRVASTRLATYGAGFRAFNTLTGLGGAVISSVTDIPVRASALSFQGQSYLGELGKGMVAPIRRIVAGVGTDERKATLAALGYFNEVAVGNLATRFAPDENVPGRIQKATHTFFKWNLLGAWTDEMRRSSIESMGRFFGEMSDTAYAAISERSRRTLERFRIGADEWEAISGSALTEASGAKFLTPEGIRQVPLTRFTKLAEARITELKQGLAERVQKRAKQDAKEREWIANRGEKLREQLQEAQARLSARLEKAEGSTASSIKALQAQISKLDEMVDYASTYWDGQSTPGIQNRERVGMYGKRLLRKLGNDEGRARETMKNLAADSRQVGRDLERFKKELNEDFISRWTDRQEDLVAFADGVRDRIKQRTEMTGRELGDLDPKINRILDDTRESVASRVQQLYADEVNSAAISPDARTLATLRQGTQAGTPMGEALRLFFQFKSFGVAMMQRGFLREYYGGAKGRGGKLGMSEVRGLATFMAGSIGFGYMAMSMKDLVKGREPRPIDDLRTWQAAASQGGGFGIYGDFLFGEANRFGGGFMQTLGGPTVSKAEQVYQLWSAFKRGDDTAAKAVKLAYTNAPYLNLFYLRTAADYLVLYELQEAMNPGYLRRMERNVKTNNDQEFWMRPSEVVN